jgi:hypothetical protein
MSWRGGASSANWARPMTPLSAASRESLGSWGFRSPRATGSRKVGWIVTGGGACSAGIEIAPAGPPEPAQLCRDAGLRDPNPVVYSWGSCRRSGVDPGPLVRLRGPQRRSEARPPGSSGGLPFPPSPPSSGDLLMSPLRPRSGIKIVPSDPSRARKGASPSSDMAILGHRGPGNWPKRGIDFGVPRFDAAFSREA